MADLVFRIGQVVMHNIPTAFWVMSLAALVGCFFQAIKDVINAESFSVKIVSFIAAAIILVYFFGLVRL